MNNAVFSFPEPRHEPVSDFAPGSVSRSSLKRELDRMASTVVDIPLVIGGNVTENIDGTRLRTALRGLVK